MSVEDLIRNYQVTRNKLRFPPNAVPDHPINLTRGSTAYKGDIPPPGTPPKKPFPPPAPAIDIYKPIAFPLSFDDILEAVSDCTGIGIGILKGPTRLQNEVMARRIAVYLSLKLLPTRSLSSIGRDLQRDHTTIVHAKNKILWELSKNTKLQKDILTIEKLTLSKYQSRVDRAHKEADPPQNQDVVCSP